MSLKEKKVGNADQICRPFSIIEDYHSCFLLHFLNSSEKFAIFLQGTYRSPFQISLHFVWFLHFLHYPAQQTLLPWMSYSGARLVCIKGGSMVQWVSLVKSDSGRLVFRLSCPSHHSVTFSHAITVILASSPVSSCRLCWWRDLLVLQELFVVKQKVSFTVQDILDAGFSDDGIVAFEPLIFVLADEGGVMAAL